MKVPGSLEAKCNQGLWAGLSVMGTRVCFSPPSGRCPGILFPTLMISGYLQKGKAVPLWAGFALQLYFEDRCFPRE